MNRSPRRVVVTGCGIVTALGLGWEANLIGFREGKSAFKPVQGFDASRQRVNQAAEIADPIELPPCRLSAKEIGRIDRAGRMLIWAGKEAMDQSGWRDPADAAIILGTTCGGMELGQRFCETAIQAAGPQSRQAIRSVYYHAHVQAGLLGRGLGVEGAADVIANACASGANAVGRAWETVRAGLADRVLCGGFDALCHMVYAGFDSLQALSPTVCRPFDTARDGLLLGEGACLFTLESMDRAVERGADILGEIAGYHSTIDRHHLTQPHPEGTAAFLSMKRACEIANVSPRDVDYINAHGTGTPLNDASEANAINRWAGEHAADIPVSSTKASIGHLLGAAGAVETAVCLMAMQGQWLPPTRSCQEADSLCRFPVVTAPTNARVDCAVTNSFGFGGANASLVLRKVPCEK